MLIKSKGLSDFRNTNYFPNTGNVYPSPTDESGSVLKYNGKILDYKYENGKFYILLDDFSEFTKTLHKNGIDDNTVIFNMQSNKEYYTISPNKDKVCIRACNVLQFGMFLVYNKKVIMCMPGEYNPTDTKTDIGFDIYTSISMEMSSHILSSKQPAIITASVVTSMPVHNSLKDYIKKHHESRYDITDQTPTQQEIDNISSCDSHTTIPNWFENLHRHIKYASVYCDDKTVIIFDKPYYTRNLWGGHDNNYCENSHLYFDYYIFTNFSICEPLYIDNNKWSCVETYFQYGKHSCIDPNEKPYTALKQGRSDYLCTVPKCPNNTRTQEQKDAFFVKWDESTRFERLLKGLFAKFTIPWLKTTLINTNKRVLIEYTNNRTNPEPFFGTGHNGQGFNILGLALMFVRQKLSDTINPVDNYSDKISDEFIKILKSYNKTLKYIPHNHTSNGPYCTECKYLTKEQIDYIKINIKAKNTLVLWDTTKK